MAGPSARLSRGISLLGHALTRGPALSGRPGGVEVVADPSVLVDRIDRLADRGLDAGARLLRQTCTTMERRYGSGTELLAQLSGALVEASGPAVTGGLDAIGVGRGLATAVEAAAVAVEAAALPAEPESLRRLLEAAVGEPELARIVAAVFDRLGGDAALLPTDGSRLGLDYGYVDGARWWARPGDSTMLPPGVPALRIAEALVVCEARPLQRAEQVGPMIALAERHRLPVLLAAPAIEDGALDLLRADQLAGRGLRVVPVIIADRGRTGDPDGAELGDLAAFAGGRIRTEHDADAVSEVTAGRACDIELTRDTVLIRGGGGERQLAERGRHLAALLAETKPGEDAWWRARLRRSRLSGTVAVIMIGPGEVTGVERLRAAVRRSERLAAAAYTGGMLPDSATLGSIAAAAVAAVSTDGPAERSGATAVTVALAKLESDRARLEGETPVPAAVAAAALRLTGSLVRSVLLTAGSVDPAGRPGRA